MTVPHDWAFKPPSLYSGDKFRLMCATNGKHNAASADIEVYNTWVRGRMAARPASSWLGDFADHFWVLGSTSAVAAPANTKTRSSDDPGEPAFWLNGHNINGVGSNAMVTNYADMYDGSWANNNSFSRCENNEIKYPDTEEVFYSGTTNSGANNSFELGESKVRFAYPHTSRHPANGPLGSSTIVSVGNLASARFWEHSGVFEVGLGLPRPTPTATASPSPTPTSVPSQRKDLPSNVGKAVTGSSQVGSNDIAMGFETGDYEHGFNVRSVTIHISEAPQQVDNVVVSLRASENSVPGTEPFAFSHRASVAPGPAVFDAPPARRHWHLRPCTSSSPAASRRPTRTL